jgi:predicted permease
MQQFVILLLPMLLGILLQAWPQLSKNLLPWLNRWILWLAIPALTLLYLTRLELSLSLLLPVGVAWILFVCAWLGFRLLGPGLGLSASVISCLSLTAGLGNTSFVGFPMVRWLYGEQGLQTAMLVDQPGTFLVLGTLGLWLASKSQAGQLSAREMCVRMLQFPPFVAFLLAVLAQLLHWQPGTELAAGLQLLGSTLSPLALLAVGLQIRPRMEPELLKPLAIGLSFKLVLAPLLILGLYCGLLGLRGEFVRICVLEAAMGPMITASIVAASHELEPRLANLMVAIGVPVSLLTILCWFQVLKLF